jgi:hypothetical protein
LWQSTAAFELKASALAIASLLATPYVLDLSRRGSRDVFFVHTNNRGFTTEISLLAAAWIVPLLSRVIAGATGIPLGLLVVLALYVFTLQRAVRDRLGSVIEVRGIAQA